MMSFTQAAGLVMERLQELGQVSQSDVCLDRRYLTNEHRRANALVADWMTDSGLSHWQDAAGNLWGRLESATPNAPRLIMGSHLDTVPNGGKYDGMLGVLAPITLASLCRQAGLDLPFHLDIVGFGDEEGTRFGSTLLGSRALTGSWPEQWAGLTDENGISLAQAMSEFGLSFHDVGKAAIDPQTLLGYIELHIEQGPVLEHNDLPVGVVTGIAGARRFEFTVTGFAGHAGTVPMPMRHDSLAAASEMILLIEQVAHAQDLVATVGRIENRPNGVNVIAGKTTFSLDIRSENDEHRDLILEQILQGICDIASRRNVQVEHKQTHSAPAVKCAQQFQDILSSAIAQSGFTPLSLSSGAGHDAMAMAQICPVAMLFTRCEKGISHHPGEAIVTEDIEASLRVLFETIKQLATTADAKE